jgi:uncharacterized protein (TIGR02118 family)
MIKVSVLYPNGEDVKFDKDYYLNKHIPLAAELVGDALKGANVDFGLANGIPGEPIPYVVMTHLTFESIESFQSAFTPHAEKIMTDLPNFTNTKPIIQISEVKI